MINVCYNYYECSENKAKIDPGLIRFIVQEKQMSMNIQCVPRVSIVVPFLGLTKYMIRIL